MSTASLTEQLRDYENKWVAIYDPDERIVGSGDDPLEAKIDAERNGYKEISLFQVPPFDPIVEETRRGGDEIAARFNYDVEALGRYYQSQQSKENRVVVNRAAKRKPRETEEAPVVRD